jgi:phosphoglycerol transferase
VRVKPGASRHLIDLGVYLGAALTCCALTSCFLALWRADLRIPFVYGGVGDELTVAMGAKWLIECPWIFSNPHLGMPFGSVNFNYPQPDVFHYLTFKLLGLTTTNFGWVMNWFYLLTFPATCLCTLYVLRQMAIGCPAALLGSLLYTFLPYHFMRGEAHLFLGAYYLVPFVALLMFRVASESPPLLKQGAGKWPRLGWRDPGFIGAAAICVIAGSSGVYYAFFASFLIMVTGLAATAAQRRIVPLLSALLLAGLIALVVVLCLLPHLLLGQRNISTRASGDAETYALKVTQLLLPVSGHRLPALAALKNNYYHAAPLVNENDAATLGLVGSFGFLLLLCWGAFRLMGANAKWLDRDDQRILSVAALLTLAATLLGTIGGLGSLFAVLISPQIRSYNRISVFIAFFCLLAVVLALDRGVGARVRSRASKLIYCSGVALLGLIGLYDQTTPIYIPNYRSNAQAFRSDARFVRSIEKKVPSGAMIFQLPYLTYPEASRYDLVRGYLHSKTLRWSYGAMMNERSDLWVRSTQEQPPSEMVRRLAGAGFSGIYLDRKLLAANGPAMEAELSRILGEQPLISQESQLSFFSLESYRATLAAKQ